MGTGDKRKKAPQQKGSELSVIATQPRPSYEGVPPLNRFQTPDLKFWGKSLLLACRYYRKQQVRLAEVDGVLDGTHERQVEEAPAAQPR